MTLPLFGLSMLLAVALCVHVIRTGQQMYWLWIILALQPLGGIVYLVAILIPSWTGGPAARRLQKSARDTLDPTREYRAAKAACDDAPTVANQMRLAKAAARHGRYDEAEALYGQAAQGIHADDPALLLGRAEALIELGRFGEALPLLDTLDQGADRNTSPAAILARARAYEGLGRIGEADSVYQSAASRMPGFEGLCRYAAFLARAGRKDEAAEALADIDRRLAKASPQFRKEGRAWRDIAARALAGN